MDTLLKNKIQGALHFLQEHTLMTLATIDLDGYPHVSTLYYYADPDMNIYFLTRGGTEKVKNMKAHSVVSLAVSDEQSMKTLVIKGTAELVDHSQADHVLGELYRITTHGGLQVPPVMKIKEDHVTLFKVTPKKYKYVNYQWETTPVIVEGEL